MDVCYRLTLGMQRLQLFNLSLENEMRDGASLS